MQIIMSNKASFFLVMLAAFTTPATSFSPKLNLPHHVTESTRCTNLDYQKGNDLVQFDPASLLDIGQQTVERSITVKAPSSTRTSSRATARSSPITSLRTLEDYQSHVINEPSKLVLVRFHAPWCKVCQTTNVSFERMASKLSKMDVERGTKFVAVSVDGKDETTELKESLGIEGVPMGVLYHPAVGQVGKVNLNRGNVSELKKRLEGYMNGEIELGMILDGMMATMKPKEVKDVSLVM